MEFDFAAILVALTVLSGAIWLLDRLFLARARRRREVAEGRAPREPAIVEYARSFFPVILAVLIFRSFIAEPFRIPSGSMMPTLDVGDFILVNKFSYGLRLPVLNDKVLGIGEPRRGDVVVFRYPMDPRQDWIKRVVGVPGDQVTFQDKQLYLNGKPVKQTLLRRYAAHGEDEGKMLENAGAVLREEHLGGVDHEVLEIPGLNRSPEGTWKVPAGYYFVMGDNRDNSLDSRYWGLMPEKNLVGKAFLIWFSWRGLDHGVEFSRIGNVID